MARRVLTHAHIRCLCGELCPLITCCCGQKQDGTCTWCTWWDIHEPHDYPARNNTDVLKVIEEVVDMVNNSNIDPDLVYPPGRYQGD